MKNVVSLLILTLFINFATTAKILSVIPSPSYSHFVVVDKLLKELANRGHDVTVVGCFPRKTPIKNYRDVELTGFKELFKEKQKELNLMDYASINEYPRLLIVHELAYELMDRTYNHENVRKLLNSNETFDMVIVENFFDESIAGFCYRFEAHCVWISSIGSSIKTNRLVGNVGLASYVTHFNTDYIPDMNFLQRLNNLMLYVFHELAFRLYYLPKHDRLLKASLPNAPYLGDLITNTTMVLLNSDPTVSYSLALTPNVKEIAGLHIDEDVKLPADVQKFLDDHDEGVVYFAIGSNLDGKDLPPEKMSAVVTAFRRWQKPVLWKFDGDLPNDLPNVMATGWLPQTAVLAHKNVNVFITHCGRVSTIESIYFGVPMIGIPIFAEQPYNAAQIQHGGYGLVIPFDALTNRRLYDALVEITTNPKYAQEAQLRSRAFREKPQKPLDEAIFWLEYVLKFNGAPFWKSDGVDLPWYKFWMVDIATFLLLVLYSIKKICCGYCKKPKADSNKKKEKQKKL